MDNNTARVEAYPVTKDAPFCDYLGYAEIWTDNVDIYAFFAEEIVNRDAENYPWDSAKNRIKINL